MDSNNDWKQTPTSFEYFDGKVDYILCIDETGTPSLKNYNQNNIWFSMTGILIEGEVGLSIITDLMKIKRKHWKNATFKGKRVIFHSREYRKKIGAFNPKFVNNEVLENDLYKFLAASDFKIIASGINKNYLTTTYSNPYAIYWYSLLFIVERFAMFLEKKNKKGAIILESRGRREDKGLLESITPNIENGTHYVSDKACSHIKGIYFNKKRTIDNKQSYPFLEIADMVGYVIHNKISQNIESNLYNIIKNKIYNYPHINGYGLKIFNRK
ncbi:DUF3800 domain-containing protein [Lactococcus lactis]|uniref:DUF3800 domain-containing protein n=1 Tax=Lactococcus lactis TaxID=1358 RepID=UPI000CE3BFF9|nr:DUF3800 domain-containing protein [Lactococcus lactis]MDG4957981.1 DUF3800 domain-containing protein [Lactococcus lactis]PPA67049.1 hypothetical protein C3952_09095 [Lactococcus lactis]